MRPLVVYTHVRKVVLLALTVMAVPPAVADERLPNFEATFVIRYGPLTGTLLMRLSHFENGYVYETSLRPQGLAALLRNGTIYESTTLELNGDNVRPLDYASIDSFADPNRTARYFFDAERVLGVYKWRQVDAPMVEGGQNRLSAHIAMMHALRAGLDRSGFAIFDRGRWKDYRFEVIPDQAVTTDKGRFEAIELQYTSSDGKRSTSLYLAPSISYLPVMIVYRENGKQKSRAQLSDYWLAPALTGPE